MLISVPPYLLISRTVQYIKRRSSRKLQGEFQKLRERYCTVLYWRQYLWAKGYFVEMSEQVSAMDVQKYIEEQEAHHRHDHFKVSEF